MCPTVRLVLLTDIKEREHADLSHPAERTGPDDRRCAGQLHVQILENAARL